MRRPVLLLSFAVAFAACAESFDPKADAAAEVRVGSARFTVLTDRLLRLEWSADGRFEDRATLTFVNRHLSVPKFTAVREGEGVVIDTGRLKLVYRGGRFAPETLAIDGWKFGDADAGNLLGTARTVDEVGSLKDLLPRMGKGILSRDGWAVVDDSTNHVFVAAANHWKNWVAPRPQGDRQDLYYFGYGHDYKGALADYAKVAGRIALPPKWCFGYWWSRYWLYSDREVKDLVSTIKSMDVPMDVMILDMDWHETWECGKYGLGKDCPRDEFGQKPGWTGYTWNRRLFPNPDETLGWLHARGLKVGANLHPASGIEPREDCYAAFKRDYGWTGDGSIPYRLTDPKWADVYFKDALDPLERQGIDFWWLDWQQWLTDKDVPGLSNTFWLNHVFAQHQAERDAGKLRPFIYHRWGGLGSHRYQIGFSGDSIVSWDTLAYMPWFTATSANVGYGYWGHDLGGHMQPATPSLGKDGDLFLRWLQAGVFQPIFKTHSCCDPSIERRIWQYPEEVAELRAAIRLRYRLVPYLYTQARTAWETGVSVCRPMYYEWPEDGRAYETTARQYMFGDKILAGTIAAPKDPVTQLSTCAFWLPKGDWFDVETGTLLKGDCSRVFQRTKRENAWFVKAGSILPLYPDDVTSIQTADPAKMALAVYPGAAAGEGELYEDAGEAADYETAFAKTRFAGQQKGASYTLRIGACKGSFPGLPETRTWEVRFVNRMPPRAVTVNGRPADWTYAGDDLTLVVTTPPVRTDAETTVEVSWNERDLADERRLDGKRGFLNRALDAGAELKIQTRQVFIGANLPNEFLDFSQLGSQLSAAPGRAHELLDGFDAALAAFPEVFARRSGRFPKDFVERFRVQLGLFTAPYADDAVLVRQYRTAALALARKKSDELGGGRIAVGGKFRGHFQSDAVSSVFWALETEKGEFPITETLDNFYRFADPDGFINREYAEDGTPVWSTEHPISFITPMLAWGELAIADSPKHAVPGRLEEVYPKLARHHAVCRGRWRRPDGLYYSSPLGSGMDDLPRWPRGWTREQIAADGIPFTQDSLTPKFAHMWEEWASDHAGMECWNRQAGWIDISAAMALDAKCLAEIARRLGRADEAAEYQREHAELAERINRLCWDEELGFYCDVLSDGSTVKRRHLGALWTLVSGVATPDRVRRMKESLFDPDVFYRTVPLASLERGDPDYTSERLYWRGPAWPRLNNLAIRGLLAYGHRDDAERLARRWYDACASLFVRFGGHYENVSSEQLDHPKSHLCAPDYTGDACLTPVAFPALFGWGK